MSTLLEPVCHVCGIPSDAGFFDDSSVVDVPAVGDEKVLARFQLHPNYCGALLYFAQFTNTQAEFPAAVLTPGLEWEIRSYGRPREPYLRFDRIINFWGLSGFPIHLRLEEGCLTELVVRGVNSRLRIWKLSRTSQQVPQPRSAAGCWVGIGTTRCTAGRLSPGRQA